MNEKVNTLPNEDPIAKAINEHNNKLKVDTIDELMGKLPNGSRIRKENDKLFYYPNEFPDGNIDSNDYMQKPNETFTQFIQRIVENE